MACLPVCLVCLSALWQTTEKGWIRSKETKKPNQSRANHTFGTRPLCEKPPLFTESLVTSHWPYQLLASVLLTAWIVADQPLAASRQYRDLAPTRGQRFLPNVVHAHHDHSAPSHHIRACSLSFYSTEILDPSTVPDSDLGPYTADHTRHAHPHARCVYDSEIYSPHPPLPCVIFFSFFLWVGARRFPKR